MVLSLFSLSERAWVRTHPAVCRKECTALVTMEKGTMMDGSTVLLYMRLKALSAFY